MKKSNPSSEPDSQVGQSSRWFVNITLLVLAILLVGATARRTYQNYSQPNSEFNWSAKGHSDFHNGAYYPATALRDGVNPYSAKVMELYPVTCPSRPCPPITFISHIPFTFLDLHTADAAFFAYNTSLLLLLAWLSVRMTLGRFDLTWWLAVTCFLLVSRPGHITLFTGYCTLELVIGTLLALHFGRSKPWLSAIGMLIASGKPTFILPLIVLMIARKNYRAVLIGIIFCTIAGVGGLAWLAKDSSFSEVVAGIVEGQEAFHEDETEFPINTWTRTDLLAMVAKGLDWVPDDKVYLAGMLGLLIIPCIVIYRVSDLEPDVGAAGLTGCISVLTILLAIYHHSYDCLLLTVPLVGIILASDRILPDVDRRLRWILGLLFVVPFLNYLSTMSARNVLKLEQESPVWQAITLINGLCLLCGLCVLLVVAHKYIRKFRDNKITTTAKG